MPIGANPPKITQNSPESPSACSFPSSENVFHLLTTYDIKRTYVNLIIMYVDLPTIATSHVPSWYFSFKNWITSNAFALSCIFEFAPLNWKILSLVSKINTSSWFNVDREKGTWINNHHQNQINKYIISKGSLVILQTCFNLTTRFPLQVYNRVWNSSSSTSLKPDATPPSSGIIHGLKYDKNLSDSWPWSSLYWTARPPRHASSSTVFIAAVPASSWFIYFIN